MSLQARLKKERYRLAGRSKSRWCWPKGHPPKAVRGQSGRHVLIINSGIYEVTAKLCGTRDVNRFVCRLADHHMRKHRVPETAYGVYTFSSKRAMLRWLQTWHHMGDWKPRLRDFKIEWLR